MNSPLQIYLMNLNRHLPSLHDSLSEEPHYKRNAWLGGLALVGFCAAVVYFGFGAKA